MAATQRASRRATRKPTQHAHSLDGQAGVSFLVNWCARVELSARQRAATARKAPVTPVMTAQHVSPVMALVENIGHAGSAVYGA